MEGKLSKKEKNELVGGKRRGGEKRVEFIQLRREQKRGARLLPPSFLPYETESLFSSLPSELLSVLTHGGEEGGGERMRCVLCN